MFTHDQHQLMVVSALQDETWVATVYRGINEGNNRSMLSAYRRLPNHRIPMLMHGDIRRSSI